MADTHSTEFHPVAGIFPLMGERELQELADDIRAHGLREPIWIHERRILDGRNRYLACQRAGVEPEYRVWDGNGSLVAFVVSLNLHRRHLDESQRAMVAAKIATLEDGQRKVGKFADVPTQAESAEMLTVSERSVRSAREVIEQGAPELVAAVEAGHVAVSTAAVLTKFPAEEQREIIARGEHEIMRAAREIRSQKREARREEVRAKLDDVAAREVMAPTGEYDCIVIDPPWPMEKIERDERPNQVEFAYPTMSEEQLHELKIPASDDCHVWLWTTHKFLPMAFRLLDTWGLSYVCTFVWHKPGGFQPYGLPQYNCEFALYARKGSPLFLDTKALPVCFEAPRGAHSEKPDAFYDTVRRVTAGRRLDMFNRREIEGFKGWGKEAA